MKAIKRLLFKIIALAVFLVAFLAASDNSEAVALTFLDYSTPVWPISWWVLGAFLLGLVFSWLIHAVSSVALSLIPSRQRPVVETQK